MDDVEALRKKVYSLFSADGSKRHCPPVSMPAISSSAERPGGNGTAGAFYLPPSESANSQPRPTAIKDAKPASIYKSQLNAHSSLDGQQGKTTGAVPSKNNPPSGKDPKSPTSAAIQFSGPVDPAKIDEVISAAALSVMVEGAIDADAAKAHLAGVIAGVTDPIERMLRENFVLVHYSLIHLQVKAVEATDAPRTQTYHALIVRLLAEQRMLGQAINDRRLSSVADPKQNGGSVSKPATPAKAAKRPIDQTKLGDKTHEQFIGKHARPAAQKSPPGRRGTDQRPAASTVAA